MILGRQETFASKNTIGRSALDAVGASTGFLIVLVMLGVIREVLGNGSFLGVDLFGARFEPWVVMVLPPGGFLTVGIVLLVIGWWKARRSSGTPTLGVIDETVYTSKKAGAQ
jgi:Na+-translocating ferredoxin:NAD+ oxidoreductase subunit E